MPTTNTTAAKPARKITTGNKAAKPAVAAKPVAPVATAAPVAKPATPVAATPAVPAVAKPAAHIVRTAAAIVRNATNFGELSDRDNAYLAFYGKLSRATPAGTVTLSDIVAAANRGDKPNYTGSCKPHDAGVINRLGKAGLINRATDGTSFTLTAIGKSRTGIAA